MHACFADETARWPGFVSLHERLLDGPGSRHPRPFLFVGMQRARQTSRTAAPNLNARSMVELQRVKLTLLPPMDDRPRW